MRRESETRQNRSSISSSSVPPVVVTWETVGVMPQSGFAAHSGSAAGVKLSGVSRLL